jgi:MoaA/NifB/PqqE/SkfB family radical SAM enzyme
VLTVDELKREPLYQNAMLNIGEMHERKTVLESFPLKVFVEPTQRCDLNCVMCGEGRRKYKADMSLELFEKVEKTLFPLASEVDFFIDGETLLARDIDQMLKSTEKYPFLPKIFTNAAHTKEESIKLLAELGFFVNISIDGATKRTYEKIRKGALWERTISNIEKYVEYREKVRNPRFHIRFAYTISPLNLHEVLPMVNLCKDMGVNDIFLNNCDKNFLLRKYQLTQYPEAARERILEAKEFADRHRIRFSSQKKIRDVEIDKAHNWEDFSLPIDRYALDYLEKYNPYNGTCYYPWTQTLVRSDGSVASCCQGLLEMGQFTNENFIRIWNGKKYQHLRKRKSYYHCGMNLTRWRCQITKTSVWGNF